MRHHKAARRGVDLAEDKGTGRSREWASGLLWRSTRTSCELDPLTRGADHLMSLRSTTRSGSVGLSRSFRRYGKGVEPKELFIVGAGHVDLYYRADYMAASMAKLDDFFAEHLRKQSRETHVIVRWSAAGC